MTRIRIAATTAVASLAGAAVLGMGATAAAQTYPPVSGAAPVISDSTPAPGQRISVSTAARSFDPGTTVRVSVPGLGIGGSNTSAANGGAGGGSSVSGADVSGTATADANGRATFSFEVPENAQPGPVAVVFNGVLNGAATTEQVSFTVVAAGNGGNGNAGGGGDSGSNGNGAGGGDGGGNGNAGGGGADRGSALPFTGSEELVPLAITGIAMVGVGAGIAVAARRRTATDLPADLA